MLSTSEARRPIERALERLVRDGCLKLGVDEREILEEVLRQATTALVRGLGAEYGRGSIAASQCAAHVLREAAEQLGGATSATVFNQRFDAVVAELAAVVAGRSGEA